MWTVEERILRLQQTVTANSGQNVADTSFSGEVDDLLSAFYDDIGELRNISLRSLFYLFLLKTLYVERRSSDASVLDYLTGMMAEFLHTRDLFPLIQDNRRLGYLLSDLMREMDIAARFPNLFEAYRKLGDYSLFIAGVFPASLQRRRRWDRWRKEYRTSPGIDIGYHVISGKNYYRIASDHDMASATQQREMLQKLSNHFNIYREAMLHASEQYILGFDINLIADKMLDSFNRYRLSGDAAHLENARKYAAILKVDRASFPSLWRLRRRPRAAIL